jgi:hypothetical protein
MLKSFLESTWRRILKLLGVGSRIMAGSILLLVSGALLLAVVPICWLLMILTQNRMLCLLLCWTVIMSGILLALVSVFNLAVP